MKHAFLAAAAVLAGAFAHGAAAMDLRECAAISDDGKRLACYDGLAKAAPPKAGSQMDREEALIRDDTIDRCQAQMGSFGASMVKACVDEDMSAYRELRTLAAEHGAIVKRCRRQMVRFGWSMVLACSEEDIEAERALKQMRN